ncbi:hypothetical protein KAR91_05140 [Candidatus Pacearchaeota archaeon]|nr:hypothetical protein [Candidatus Pacearchaeota archaeon]
MKVIIDFISDLTKRVSSRKFIVLIIAVALHMRDMQSFNGENLVWVFGIFIGADVAEKMVKKVTK